MYSRYRRWETNNVNFKKKTSLYHSNYDLFVPNLELSDQVYSNKPSYEKVIPSKNSRNLGFNVHTGNFKDNISSIHFNKKLRCGGDNLPENPDQSLEKMNESLKESLRLEELQKNLASRSGQDSGSLSDRSFNKIVLGVLDKLEPIIGNPKFLRLLTETQKPVKSELSVLVQSLSKENPKPQKNSAKKSSSIFAETLVPLNPRRWTAFVAGSSMASDMPDLEDKIKTPLNNLLVGKEYLETAQSDTQWRDRF